MPASTLVLELEALVHERNSIRTKTLSTSLDFEKYAVVSHSDNLDPQSLAESQLISRPIGAPSRSLDLASLHTKAPFLLDNDDPQRVMPEVSSTRSRVTVEPTSDKLRRLGRWTTAQDAECLVASWCGASISFLFSGSFLSMRTGSRTERKDSLNGGTPTIACSIVAHPTTDGDPSADVKTYDCKPSQEVVLVDTDTVFARILPVKITLTLIDWASVFELESIILDSGGSIQALPDDPRPLAVRVLVIGDSITAGYSDGSQQIDLGCLSAYPHIAKEQIYASTGIEIEPELVAFPGVTLVAPTPEEADEGAGQGMIDRFFQASPWLDEPAALDEQPSIILIVLGTNDDAQDVSPDRFASTMHSFVDSLLQTYRTSVQHVCVLHPFPDFTDDSEPEATGASEQVPITRDLASVLTSLRPNAGYGIEFHEWDIGGGLRREHTMDGLHPTLPGHRILGDALAQELVKLSTSITQTEENDFTAPVRFSS